MQSMFVRIESLVPQNGKMCELINYVCQPWIEHPVFFASVGQSTSSQSVSSILGRGRFDNVDLPLVRDCTTQVLFFASVHRGIPLDISFINFIVQTLNYANIMSRIDCIFIIYYNKQKTKIHVMYFISETTLIILLA